MLVKGATLVETKRLDYTNHVVDTRGVGRTMEPLITAPLVSSMSVVHVLPVKWAGL